jgi:hypothetical protein
MTLPPNIRVNVATPFPALVTGQNGISLGKQNGIWQVQLNVPSLATAVPPVGAFPTQYVIVWDSTLGAYSKVTLSTLQQGIATAPPPVQRSVVTSPITVAPSDAILNINISVGSPACTLPGAATRLGAWVQFKDAGGMFATHPLTITPAGGELIDGLASVTLGTARQRITLTPYNDGVNTGWEITG